MQTKRDNSTTGAAGTFFVAAALSMQDIIVTMTLRNARGIDLLATNGLRSIMIQVKTSSNKIKEWQVGKEIEKEHSENLFFVFVNLGESNEIPSFHIVPSVSVAQYCKQKADEWVNAASGDKRIEREKYPTWKFRDKDNIYLNRWDLLGLNFK